VPLRDAVLIGWRRAFSAGADDRKRLRLSEVVPAAIATRGRQWTFSAASVRGDRRTYFRDLATLFVIPDVLLFTRGLRTLVGTRSAAAANRLGRLRS